MIQRYADEKMETCLIGLYRRKSIWFPNSFQVKNKCNKIKHLCMYRQQSGNNLRNIKYNKNNNLCFLLTFQVVSKYTINQGFREVGFQESFQLNDLL